MFKDTNIEELSVTQIHEWRTNTGDGKLLLPPIQRSLVWNNEKIINFWDSLLRGYPIGMMLVHEAKSQGYDYSGELVKDIKNTDYQLFDGQQRLAAILLGYGGGSLKKNRQIWVDLGKNGGKESASSENRLFSLRISSISQPCGYQLSNPNAKFSLDERRKWQGMHESQADWEIGPLLGGKCCIPLNEIIGIHHKPSDLNKLQEKYLPDADIFNTFIHTLKSALMQKVVFQLIDSKIVNNPDEYLRFFQRIGQGGVALSDKELTYSVIKNHFPEVRVAAEKIAQNPDCGRLIEEVDLVLACLRVAKILEKWHNQYDWELVIRPNPSFAARINIDELKAPREFFMGMLNSDQLPLLDFIAKIRDAIEYSDRNSTGLPVMLLARLPYELFDVLLLWAMMNFRSGEWNETVKNLLCKFSIYWLIFVRNHDKAATHVYSYVRDHGVHSVDVSHINQLINDFESQGWAYQLPTEKELDCLEDDVNSYAPDDPMLLREYAHRFACRDNLDRQPGLLLREITGMRNIRLQRLLMWLQREYLAEFKEYDPTLADDQDLPVDLDHLIPQSKFGFNWTERRIRLGEEKYDDNFRWLRDLIGNHLGNFRWLKAEDNRKRQDGPIDSKSGEKTLFMTDDQELIEWNELIRDAQTQKWTRDDILKFQRLIDLRTLRLYRGFIRDSGLYSLIATNEKDK